MFCGLRDTSLARPRRWAGLIACVEPGAHLGGVVYAEAGFGNVMLDDQLGAPARQSVNA
jgi:hypothetical protein